MYHHQKEHDYQYIFLYVIGRRRCKINKEMYSNVLRGTSTGVSSPSEETPQMWKVLVFS
jgi:hypothetical protein